MPLNSSSRLLSVAAGGAFLLLGVIYPILGPALPTLTREFGLSATSAAVLLSANSAGGFMGVLAAGLLAGRWSPRSRCMWALALIGIACVGLAYAPTFALAAIASLLIGLGFGVLDITINVWVATGFGARSAAALNLLSAAFGVGAVLAPLTVGLADGNMRVPLLGCAVLAAFLLPWFFALRDAAAVAASEPSPSVSRGPMMLTVGFALLFVTYVAAEAGIGSWEVTHLQEGLGMSTAQASKIASLFWVTFTLGRVGAGMLALRMAPERLVIGSLVLAAASIAMGIVPSGAPAGYTLAGLFLAPVFTTALVWMAREKISAGVTTLVFASGFLGPVMFAPAIGTLKDAYGVTAIPATLAAITLACVVIAVVLRRVAGGAPQGARVRA